MNRSVSKIRILQNGLWILATLMLSGCASAYLSTLAKDTDRTFSRVFLADYNSTWNATIGALKYATIPEKKPETGVLVTDWIDNTQDKNFSESFGEGDRYLKGQYRFKVRLVKLTKDKKEVTRVDVRKEQMVQYDELEGWRPLESDALDENTLLYRIARLLLIARQTETVKVLSPLTAETNLPASSQK